MRYGGRKNIERREVRALDIINVLLIGVFLGQWLVLIWLGKVLVNMNERQEND